MAEQYDPVKLIRSMHKRMFGPEIKRAKASSSDFTEKRYKEGFKAGPGKIPLKV